MTEKIRCAFSWSGGKDCSLALNRLLQNPAYEICYLVTTINDSADRISMHGVRTALLLAQAESIGIPLYQIRLPEMPDMETYDRVMEHHYLKFKKTGITHIVYGDIFLQDLKDYHDARLAEAGLTGIYPLWRQDTRQLIDEFLNKSFQAIIVCTQSHLEAFVGEELTAELISALPAGVDVCGENGEFHTFTYAGPIFNKSIDVMKGEKVFKTYKAPQSQDSAHAAVKVRALTGFWYCDLLPA